MRLADVADAMRQEREWFPERADEIDSELAAMEESLQAEAAVEEEMLHGAARRVEEDVAAALDPAEVDALVAAALADDAGGIIEEEI